MAKYHINPSSGDVAKCRATAGKCPFGGERQHYESAREARMLLPGAATGNILWSG